MTPERYRRIGRLYHSVLELTPDERPAFLAQTCDGAAIELRRGDAQQAVASLEGANRYEAAARFWPQHLRGQAYLKLGLGAEAAVEFQKILDHRGQAPLSVLYPLAHLGLARASAMSGDATNARRAYQDFFTLWKDADPDLPLLVEAKKEYEKVK